MTDIGNLITHIIEDQRRIDEVDWKRMAGTAALAGALLTGTPSQATAATKHHHHGLARQNYSEQDYINSIAGEAGNQGYQGMLALACALRNRMKVPYYKNNVLNGVYGRTAPQLKNEPKSVFDTARKAWADSANQDIVGGAYIWGSDSDIEKFKQQSWFKNVVATVRVKDHTFFKDK